MEELDISKVPSLKKTQLVEQLKNRRLSTVGKKDELAQRLIEHINGCGLVALTPLKNPSLGDVTSSAKSSSKKAKKIDREKEIKYEQPPTAVKTRRKTRRVAQEKEETTTAEVHSPETKSTRKRKTAVPKKSAKKQKNEEQEEVNELNVSGRTFSVTSANEEETIDSRPVTPLQDDISVREHPSRRRTRDVRKSIMRRFLKEEDSDEGEAKEEEEEKRSQTPVSSRKTRTPGKSIRDSIGKTPNSSAKKPPKPPSGVKSSKKKLAVENEVEEEDDDMSMKPLDWSVFSEDGAKINSGKQTESKEEKVEVDDHVMMSEDESMSDDGRKSRSSTRNTPKNSIIISDRRSGTTGKRRSGLVSEKGTPVSIPASIPSSLHLSHKSATLPPHPPSNRKGIMKPGERFKAAHQKLQENQEYIGDYQARIVKRHEELTGGVSKSVKRLATPKSEMKKIPLRQTVSSFNTTVPTSFNFGSVAVEDIATVQKKHQPPCSNIPTLIVKQKRTEKMDAKQISKQKKPVVSVKKAMATISTPIIQAAPLTHPDDNSFIDRMATPKGQTEGGRRQGGYTPYTGKLKFVDTTKLTDNEYQLAVESGLITKNGAVSNAVKMETMRRHARDKVMDLRRKLNIK